MTSWAFFTGDGNELTRGWQGTEEQARKLAQRKANETGATVEFQAESELLRPEHEGDGWAAPCGEVVEPSEVV